MAHLITAGVLFVILPFALIGAATLWEHLTNDNDNDDDRPTR